MRWFLIINQKRAARDVVRRPGPYFSATRLFILHVNSCAPLNTNYSLKDTNPTQIFHTNLRIRASPTPYFSATRCLFAHVNSYTHALTNFSSPDTSSIHILHTSLYTRAPPIFSEHHQPYLIHFILALSLVAGGARFSAPPATFHQVNN